MRHDWLVEKASVDLPNRLKGNLKLISSNKVKFVEGPEQEYRGCLSLSLPNLAKSKFQPNVQISFWEILRNKQHHM